MSSVRKIIGDLSLARNTGPIAPCSLAFTSCATWSELNPHYWVRDSVKPNASRESGDISAAVFNPATNNPKIPVRDKDVFISMLSVAFVHQHRHRSIAYELINRPPRIRYRRAIIAPTRVISGCIFCLCRFNDACGDIDDLDQNSQSLLAWAIRPIFASNRNIMWTCALPVPECGADLTFVRILCQHQSPRRGRIAQSC